MNEYMITIRNDDGSTSTFWETAETHHEILQLYPDAIEISEQDE